MQELFKSGRNKSLIRVIIISCVLSQLFESIMPTLKPHSLTRRHFLYASALTLASSALSAKKVVGANETVRLGLIGCGRRSGELLNQFLKISNVEFVAISDPDTAQMDNRLKTIREIRAKAANGIMLPETRVNKIRDYRKLLERPDIDAVIVPSTNFWHSLHAIHAVQAGKHVYVEKPATFKHFEGRQLEAAAERYSKIIGIGYQNRSDPAPQEGIRYVQEGNLGKIRKVRALCYRNRDSIGKIDQPLKPPATISLGTTAATRRICRPSGANGVASKSSSKPTT